MVMIKAYMAMISTILKIDYGENAETQGCFIMEVFIRMICKLLYAS